MYRIEQPSKNLSQVGKSILNTLLYFDIFSYPLTLDEIVQCNSQKHISREQIEKTINGLIDRKVVFRFDHLYSLHPNEENAERRKRGNMLAEQILKKAQRMSRLIASFPFVRGVCLSGSISKNFMDKKSDVDYFIITAPRRLWIARMSLIFFKKVFLFNSKKYFCVNYFVSADRMEIEEKNIFTATEIKTLLPTYGAEIYGRFQQVNKWTDTYYPNYKLRNCIADDLNGWVHKRLVEKILDNDLGNWLDKQLMKLTVTVWKTKFKDFEPDDFEIALKSRQYVSKHHPNHFQEKVLKAYEDKITAFEKKHNISLNGL